MLITCVDALGQPFASVPAWVIRGIPIRNGSWPGGDPCRRPHPAWGRGGDDVFPRSRWLGNGACADIWGDVVIHPPPGGTRFLALGGHRLENGARGRVSRMRSVELPFSLFPLFPFFPFSLFPFFPFSLFPFFPFALFPFSPPRPHCRAGPRTTRMIDEPAPLSILAPVGSRRIIGSVGAAYHIAHGAGRLGAHHARHALIVPVPLHRAHALPISCHEPPWADPPVDGPLDIHPGA